MENTSENTTETEAVTVVSKGVDMARELFNEFYADSAKFYTKGTASAAARARKSASALAKHFKVVRKELQVAKQANAAAKKAAKAVAPAVVAG